MFCRERDCYSDEHFVPVLLAAHGLDNETTCRGNTMSVLWSTGAGAPLLQLAQGIAMPVQSPEQHFAWCLNRWPAPSSIGRCHDCRHVSEKSALPCRCVHLAHVQQLSGFQNSAASSRLVART